MSEPGLGAGAPPGAGPLAGALLRRELPGAGAVAFCADLVRIPSPSGHEEAAVRRCVEEMLQLGFDEAHVDAAGNAVGIVRSRHRERRERCLLLNSHLDVVDTGDTAAWTFGPHSAEIVDGRLFGRGASDAKSCVAAQVHAAAMLCVLRDEGVAELRHDVVVSAVVQEEVGGLGTAALLDAGLRPAGAIVGEPSLGDLAFGHRGRVETEVRWLGVAGHASRPDLAHSPHPSAARFVLALSELPHDEAPRIGRSTAAITQASTLPSSVNVIPEELRLIIDWRNVPSELPARVLTMLAELAERCADPGIRAEARIPEVDTRSWTGVNRTLQRVSRPFSTDPEGEPLIAALATLRSGLGRNIEAVAWDFASDGGWLEAAGATCLGYGPGDLACMHVRDESVSVALIEEAVMGNVLLLCSLDESLCRAGA